MAYSIHEHKHRFAAWAASRAASVKSCRFSAKIGREILEHVNLSDFLVTPEALPVDNMDVRHLDWRTSVINAADRFGLTFTHGVAAKLINVYFKSGLMCGGHHDDVRVKALHPPIDRTLLRTLDEKNYGDLRREWKAANRIGWSNFDSDEYQAVINAIRQAQQKRALWEIEEHWPGHQ